VTETSIHIKITFEGDEVEVDNALQCWAAQALEEGEFGPALENACGGGARVRVTRVHIDANGVQVKLICPFCGEKPTGLYMESPPLEE